MNSTSIQNVVLAMLFAVALVSFGAVVATVQAAESPLYVQCHNGIDDDNDGFIDLLDSQCAEFRPVCEAGFHSNEVFECVADEVGDPVCTLPEVLVDHVCTAPQTLECEAPQVPNEAQTACVDPAPVAPTCVGGQTLSEDQTQCIEPVCTETQTLNTETHMCVDNAPVDPVCTENQTLNTETHTCVDNVVVPTCTEAQHLDNNVCVDNAVTPPPSGGGGNSGGGSDNGNGPIAGSLGGGGSIVPGGNGGNGPISGQVLGASTGGLPELPAGCTAIVTSYMRMGKHNDSEQVKVLQQFLNKELGLSIEITGFFGKDTDAGVRQFQLAHVPQILTPWGITDATGYVYKTTSRWINLMSCQSLDIPMPELN